MPSLRIWCGSLLLSAGPCAYAASQPAPAPSAVKAPDQPSASLLEFIGDWNEDELHLIGMEYKVEQPAQPQQPKPREVRNAP